MLHTNGMAVLPSDTSLGGPGRGFEATPWSVIARARHGTADERRRALEHLIHRYWRPLYFYARLEWREDREASKDLIQGFFASLLEGDTLAGVQRKKGRFRYYIKAALKNYIQNQRRAKGALKRGGGHPVVSLDELGAADPPLPADGASPDEMIDREWKRALIGHALILLRQACESEGKQSWFRVFEAYHLSKDANRTHDEVAAQLGLTPAVVNNYLVNARERFRRIVCDLVAETVSDPEGFHDELRELFGGDPLP